MLNESNLIIGILVGITVLLKPVRAFIAKIWKKTLGKRTLILHEILAELKVNGGMSLRDSINRIEDTQYALGAYLNAQLNAFECAIFTTDADGNILSQNRAHQRMTGFTLEELKNGGWINTVKPADRDSTMTKWKEAIRAGREFSEDVDCIYGKVHMDAFRQLDAAGRIRGYISVVTEIGP